MPQVIPAVIKVVANFALAVTGATSAGATAAAYLIAKAVVYTALLAGPTAYSRAQAKKRMAALQAGLDQGRNVMARDPLAPRRIIYGEVPVSGTVIFMHVSGSSNEFLHVVVKLADHECESLGEVRFNDEVVPLDGSGNATGTFAGFARVKKFVGTAAGARDTDLETESGGAWTSAHLGKECARLHVRLKWDSDKFPQGLPNITCKVKGRKIYDPRTALTVWSDNVALCLMDYLRDARFSKGVPLARIRSDEVIAAANICDETVALAAGGTEKRYTCNGVITTDEDPSDVLAALAEAMAGHVTDCGGKWTIRAGAYRSPTLTLTDDDLCGSFSVAPRLSRQDTFNGVRGTYYSERNNWAPADFPAVKNDTYMGWDGGVRLWKDVAFRFTTSPARAQRLAKIELERGRQQIVVSATYMLKALNCQPGDVVNLTRSRLGWNAKPFEVLDFAFVVENGPAGSQTLAVKLTLRETASGVWDWNSGMETTVDLADNTTLYNPANVPTPAGVTAVVAAAAERTALPRVKVSWSAPADQHVVSGGWTEIEFKKAAEADWTVWAYVPGDRTFDYVSDLEVGTSYNFRVRHRNVFGRRGSYSSTATVTAAAGVGTYTALLTNEAHAVSCDSAGTPRAGEVGVGGRAVTDVLAFAGASGLSPVASGPGVGQFSIAIATHAGTATFTKTDNDTVRLDSLTTDSAVCRVTINLEGVLTVTKDFTVTKVTAGTDGNPGTNGDDAEVLYCLADVAAVNKSQAGAYTPGTVNFSAWSKIGTAAPAAYAGRFIIATFNGSWSDVYTSGGNESSKAYSVPASISAIRVRLYLAGGTATLVDEQIVPITTDGPTGPTGSQGPAGADASIARNSGSDNAGLNSGGQTTIVSVSKTGSSFLVSGSVTCECDTPGDSGVTVRIYRDSTVIQTLGFDLAAYEVEGPRAFAVTDAPGSGTYTYAVKAYRTVSGTSVLVSADIAVVG